MTAGESSKDSNIIFCIEAVSDDYKFYFDFLDFDMDSLIRGFQRYVRFFELKDAFRENTPILIALNPNAGIRYFQIFFDEKYYLKLSEISSNDPAVKLQEKRAKSEMLSAYSELSCGYCAQRLIDMKQRIGSFWFPENFNIIISRPIEVDNG